MANGNGDWAQWGKHVLAELNRLNRNYDLLAERHTEVITRLATIKIEERGVQDRLKLIEQNRIEIENLKKFKSQVITVLVVLHSLIGLGWGIVSFFL